ncbi:unnamed protein product [Arctogadus glacialis]
MDFPMRQFTIIRGSPGLPLPRGYTGTMEATTLVLLVLLDCLLVSSSRPFRSSSGGHWASHGLSACLWELIRSRKADTVLKNPYYIPHRHPFLDPISLEEAIPELEIDVDELLDMPSDLERAARVKELVFECFKPTEIFVSGLLDKIRGMQKLSTPQKK